VRLLVIEKSPKLSHLIAGVLAREGFKVDSFFTLEDAIIAVASVKAYRLIILDVGVLDDRSVGIIKEVRQQIPKTTILVTTTQNSLNNRIKILDAGADDLLVKPFPLAEMAAHCRALLRRSGNGVLDMLLSAGNITLNAATHEVFVNGDRIRLTKREINLLTQLMRRFRRVVTKAHLLDSLFAFSDEASPNAIEAIVCRLRRRLAASQANIAITTEHGIGYSLMPAVPHSEYDDEFPDYMAL